MNTKDLIYSLIICILIVSMLVMADNHDTQQRAMLDQLIEYRDDLKMCRAYQDAYEIELTQAWMDICLFQTDTSDAEYDDRYMECEVVVVRNLNSLVAQTEGE